MIGWDEGGGRWRGVSSPAAVPSKADLRLESLAVEQNRQKSRLMRRAWCIFEWIILRISVPRPCNYFH